MLKAVRLKDYRSVEAVTLEVTFTVDEGRLTILVLVVAVRVETVAVVLAVVNAVVLVVLVVFWVIDLATTAVVGLAEAVGLEVDRTGAFEEFRSCSILCCFLA